MKLAARLACFVVTVVLSPLVFAAMHTTTGTLFLGPGQTLVIGPGVERHHTGSIIVSGGRLEVNRGALFLDGSMVIRRDGAVVFDGGEFHHQGDNTHVVVGGTAQDGDGLLAFRNGGRYHWVQTYVSQHELHARNGSRIELDRTRIDADAATHVIRLFDRASYSAVATETAPGSWSTVYMSQRSQLSFASVKNGGDIVFYDAVTIDVRDSLGIMPWLYFPAGAVADLAFPDGLACNATRCPRVSKTIDRGTVPGIDWSVRIENSALVFWGINSYPGSSVTVRDSKLAMAMVRFAGDRTYVVPGEFRNGDAYEDRTFASLPDRVLRMVDTSVRWWKLDVIDGAQARFDGVTFAEMMIKNRARAFVTNSICEGQTIHLGAINHAYVYFQDGEVWTHVSAWDDATMVLDRSLVDWTLGQFPYQSRNIAHGRARLYALNSELRSPPEALDAALVTVAGLGDFAEPQLGTWRGTRTPIFGTAWIATGPQSPVRFDRWVLALRAPGSRAWVAIATGTSEVRDAILAWIEPSLLHAAGDYQLKLTLHVRGDDPFGPYPTSKFPAIKTLVVR